MRNQSRVYWWEFLAGVLFGLPFAIISGFSGHESLGKTTLLPTAWGREGVVPILVTLLASYGLRVFMGVGFVGYFMRRQQSRFGLAALGSALGVIGAVLLSGAISFLGERVLAAAVFTLLPPALAVVGINLPQGKPVRAHRLNRGRHHEP